MHARSDRDLLRSYAETGNETAFGEIVARHTDLLYSAALRQVGSPDLAKDVLQKVFTDLARKAGELAASPRLESSILGWLYRTTRYESLDLLRESRRRQVREFHAMEALDSSSPDPVDWESVRPILDDALADLSDQDREALLLRFFKNQDLAAVGCAFGVSDDAAQKRVSRALDRLRLELGRRGVTASGVALSVAISTQAVQAAPAGLAVALAGSATATAGLTSSLAGSTVLVKSHLYQTLAMTTSKKVLIGAAMTVALGTGLYEARDARHWRETSENLRQEQARLTESLLTAEQRAENAGRELAALREARTQSPRSNASPDTAEIARLRGEVVRLRAVEQQMARLQSQTNASQDPFTQSVLALTTKAAELNSHLIKSPHLAIPELNLLTESDWIEAARMSKLGSEEEVQESLMKLRGRAKHNAYSLWQEALKGYLEANGGQLPTDTLQLKPYFSEPVDDAMFRRFQMTHTGSVPASSDSPVWLIEEIAQVDNRHDTRMRMGLGSLDISVITPAP